jgi:hypothetical protein
LVKLKHIIHPYNDFTSPLGRNKINAQFFMVQNYNIVINNVGEKITILQFIFNNYSIFKIKFSHWFEFDNENNNIKYAAETIIKFSYYYFPEAPKKISLFSEQNVIGQNCTEKSY